MKRFLPNWLAVAASGGSATPSSLGDVSGEVTDRRARGEELPPLIEVGWIVAGKLDATDREAIVRARETSQEWLREAFPQFDWRLPIVEREELVQGQRVEAVVLLDSSVTERNLRHWDFTLIVTGADLISHYQNDMFAAVSRSLQAGVISTARIDPRAYDKLVTDQRRVHVMAGRIESLALHAIGHLGGLEHDDDPGSFMAGFETIGDLDMPLRLGQEAQRRLQRGFADVADRRLEEQADMRRAWRPWFYLRAAWINRRQLVKAIWQAKPWQFPFRLSRLTTAAVSAALILTTTAEVWEVGLRQPASLLALLAVTTIGVTTSYVLRKQRLLVRREHARLSELSVMTNVSTLCVVLAGMTATFLFLWLATGAVALLFYRPVIVTNWVPPASGVPLAMVYSKLASFVASLGLAIGALGASFEQQHYFRHITFVDEEI